MILTDRDIGRVVKVRICPYPIVENRSANATPSYAHNSYYALGQIINPDTGVLEDKCHVTGLQVLSLRNLVDVEIYAYIGSLSSIIADHPLDTSALPSVAFAGVDYNSGSQTTGGLLTYAGYLLIGTTKYRYYESAQANNLPLWSNPKTRIYSSDIYSGDTPTTFKVTWINSARALLQEDAYIGSAINTHLGSVEVYWPKNITALINYRYTSGSTKGTALTKVVFNPLYGLRLMYNNGSALGDGHGTHSANTCAGIVATSRQWYLDPGVAPADITYDDYALPSVYQQLDNYPFSVAKTPIIASGTYTWDTGTINIQIRVEATYDSTGRLTAFSATMVVLSGTATIDAQDTTYIVSDVAGSHV